MKLCDCVNGCSCVFIGGSVVANSQHNVGTTRENHNSCDQELVHAHDVSARRA